MGRRRRRSRATGVGVVLGLLAAVTFMTACSTDTSEETGSPAAPGDTKVADSIEGDRHPPVAFRSWKETFVDTSRSTPAGSQTPAADGRTLVTTLYLPEGSGPFPLIVFSHGRSGHPDDFSELLSAWAAAGYAVAAPAFPLTNSNVAGAGQNTGDVAEQPADVSFVLDRVLEADDDPSSPLHGRIDSSRIGAGGLSLGGATTYAVAFGTSTRDQRVKAAEVLSGAILREAGPVDLDGHIPLLIVHGDKDPTLDYRTSAQAAYAAATPPVWFVTLLGAGHASAFENTKTPYDATAAALTVAFWDATIRPRSGDFALFERVAVVDGLTTLEHK